ncbi:hypothetical protein Rsub_07413 [Raphidocelis subcapitata]|uniref:N-acetyl-D-glucosamine kinase n=1 Tax=Raphidocelis subcapitata TaxID=307507 RepID=A0A2V0PBY1_9CHLO|nr:hypothetical protein Rsub_07413 [Raphidocelis subcapitata]|eukprot:GBF94677.1 hypothetical protein Rsub_07413 [Raphidocelis subcapitata]
MDHQPTTNTDVVLGVAALCGGSHAVVLEAATGREIAAVEGPHITGWFTAAGKGAGADAEGALWTVVDAALAAAGRRYGNVAAACACFTVRDAAGDLADLLKTLAQRMPDATVKIAQPVASAALAAATGGVLQGVALIADLHTEAIAFTGGGALVHRASGWGPAFMDGGSAHDLGTRALLAVHKAHDGRGAPTALTRALLRRLALSRPEELVAWAYQSEGDRAARVAELARTVVECALAGDAVAETIIRYGVGELARSCKTAASAVGLDAEPFKVVLAGHLLQEGGLYGQYVAESIQSEMPYAEVSLLRAEPAEGAALLARQLMMAQLRERPAPQRAPHQAEHATVAPPQSLALHA